MNKIDCNNNLHTGNQNSDLNAGNQNDFIFPEEIFLHIFSYMEHKNLYELSLVCKKWETLPTNIPLLQAICNKYHLIEQKQFLETIYKIIGCKTTEFIFIHCASKIAHEIEDAIEFLSYSTLEKPDMLQRYEERAGIQTSSLMIDEKLNLIGYFRLFEAEINKREKTGRQAFIGQTIDLDKQLQSDRLEQENKELVEQKAGLLQALSLCKQTDLTQARNSLKGRDKLCFLVFFNGVNANQNEPFSNFENFQEEHGKLIDTLQATHSIKDVQALKNSNQYRRVSAIICKLFLEYRSYQ